MTILLKRNQHSSPWFEKLQAGTSYGSRTRKIISQPGGPPRSTSQNLRLSRLKLWVILMAFVPTLGAYAQKSTYSGEEELFQEQREYSTISLGFDWMVTQSARFYSSLIYSTTDHELLEAGVAIKWFLPIGKRMAFRLDFPYKLILGFRESSSRLPGLTEFKSNNGLADFSADLMWNVIKSDSAGFDVVLHVGYIFPSGQSRFDESYKGYFPIGNGFHSLNLGIGVHQGLSSKVFVFANASYVNRFSREFKSSSTYGNSITRDIDPAPIHLVGGGIGFLVSVFGEKNLINLEYQNISVGKTTNAEREFSVTRFGLRAIGIKTEGGSFISFVGFEQASGSDESTTFVYNLIATLDFSILKFKL